MAHRLVSRLTPLKRLLLFIHANRIIQRTALDYDRILVLENGSLIEDGTPNELIEKADGAFRTMCLASGEFEQLRAAVMGAA